MEPQLQNFDCRPIGERLFIVALSAFLLNFLLTAIPGYYSHDELVWLDWISHRTDSWGLGLSDHLHSPFFRPLGTIIISAALRIPPQPFASHAALVALTALSCCILYLLVSRFQPDRALAAALLFAVMPGTAYSTGWIAAFFDVQYTFFGLCALLAALYCWRQGSWMWGPASIAAFALALLCKETALTIPIAALLLAICDRERARPGRVAILGVGALAVTLIYVWFRFTALSHTAQTGGGGYGVGGFRNIAANVTSYFWFPFASDILDVGGFTDQHLAAMLIPIFIHLLLVALVWVRFGPVYVLIYMCAYYMTLLPVLIISKHETQYLFASSIIISVALAMLWSRRLFHRALVVALAFILIVHGFRVQKSMYLTGACQTTALRTTSTLIQSLKPSGSQMVFAPIDTSWWVLARALHDRTFDSAGHDIEITISHQPENTSFRLLPDCRVVTMDVQ